MQNWVFKLWPWVAALLVVSLIDFFSAWIDAYIFSIIIYTGINIILATSLNLVNGFTGQFSIGHAGFMAVGAYIASFITMTVTQTHPELLANPLGLKFLFAGALLLAGVGSALCGFVVGLPTLRLRGDYLAIATLGFGEIIRVLFLNFDAVGGARGLPGIPGFSTFGSVYSLVILTLFVLWRLIHTAFGRSFQAVASDEVASQAMGLNTTSIKVRAFVMGAFFAGIAGGLFAHYLRFINPQSFDFNRSFEIVIMVVLGGMGSLTGSCVAAILLTVLRELLRPLQEITHIDIRMILYSFLLIVLMLTKPHGLFGHHEWFELLPKRFRLRK